MRFKTPQALKSTVVVGSNLPALIYSYLNNLPIIINNNVNYDSHDFLCSDIDLRPLGFEDHSARLKKSNGTHEVGAPREYVRDRIMFNLSLSGLIYNTFIPTSVRISDNNVLTIFSKSRKYQIKYSDLHLFDCENIVGIELKKENVVYEVYDRMDIRHSNGNEVEYIEGGDEFVSQIYICPSDRNGAKKDDKDVICKSFITSQQLKSFEYSDTIVRIKATSMMKDEGFSGSKAGTSRGTTIKQKRRPFCLSVRERRVYEKYNIKCLELNNNIVINNSTERQIIDLYKSNQSFPKKTNDTLKMREVLLS